MSFTRIEGLMLPEYLTLYREHFGTFANFEPYIHTLTPPSRLARIIDLVRRIFLDILTFHYFGFSHHYRAIAVIKGNYPRNPEIVANINTWRNLARECFYCLFPPTNSVRPPEEDNRVRAQQDNNRLSNQEEDKKVREQEPRLIQELEETLANYAKGKKQESFKMCLNFIITTIKDNRAETYNYFTKKAAAFLKKQFSLTNQDHGLLNQLIDWAIKQKTNANAQSMEKQQRDLLNELCNIKAAPDSYTQALKDKLHEKLSEWISPLKADEELARQQQQAALLDQAPRRRRTDAEIAAELQAQEYR